MLVLTPGLLPDLVAFTVVVLIPVTAVKLPTLA
jgi:hypothetical protein